MTDLTYTATDARDNFFDLLKVLKKGKKRAIVKNKKARYLVTYLGEKDEKRPSWADVVGDGSKETKKAMKMVEKMMEITDKLPERGTPQW